MIYECDKCDWEGTWDEMILETLCPLCRSSVTPTAATNPAMRQGTQGSDSLVPTGAAQ